MKTRSVCGINIGENENDADTSFCQRCVITFHAKMLSNNNWPLFSFQCNLKHVIIVSVAAECIVELTFMGGGSQLLYR